MQYFRLSMRSRTNLASSLCWLGVGGPSLDMSWGDNPLLEDGVCQR
jgi:hypothetical protein